MYSHNKVTHIILGKFGQFGLFLFFFWGVGSLWELLCMQSHFTFFEFCMFVNL